MEVELTKSAEQSLIYLYKEYEHKIRNGVPKLQAMRFRDTDQNYSKVKEVIGADVAELKSAGFIKHFLYEFELTAAGILYAEKLAKNTANKAFLFLSKFLPENIIKVLYKIFFIR